MNKRTAWNKGLYKIDRVKHCPECGVVFLSKRLSKTKTYSTSCSNVCASKQKVRKFSVFINCVKCGIKFRTTDCHLKLGKKYCSNICSGSWKGGITPENTKIRNSEQYKKWRREIFARDNYTCVLCGVKNEKGLNKTICLNADHIKPFYLYPELRFELSNGRTLCLECHKKTETWGRPKK